MNNILEAKTKKHLLTVWCDDGSEYIYDDLWEEVSFISHHRDYDSKGELKDHGTLDIDTNIYEIVPVTAYIHSGIALTVDTSNNYPFNCQFDSGLFGFLVFKKGEFGVNNIGLEGFVRSWAALLNGEVYGFTIETISSCNCCNQSTNETIDSCGGFYGYNDYKELYKSMLEHVDINEADLKALKLEVEKG